MAFTFLSSLKPLHEQLERLAEIRLLIGNTTDRETLETLAEAAEAWRYPKRVAQQQAAQATAENLAEAFALMDQTDEDEVSIRIYPLSSASHFLPGGQHASHSHCWRQLGR